MIQRFSFGHPFPTQSVVLSLPAESGSVPFLTPDGSGWRFTLSEQAAVYGLGEMPRGINKRGWHYITNNTDESRGSHRYGGIWLGDNNSSWAQLLANIQMMPSVQMCGFLYSEFMKAALDDASLTLWSFLPDGEPAEYRMYRDDGVTTEYEQEEHWITLQIHHS